MANAEDAPGHERPGLERALRWSAIGIGVLVLLVIALSILADVLIDAEMVADRVRTRLSDAAAGPVHVEIGSVSPGLLSRSLSAEGVSIRIEADTGRSSDPTGSDGNDSITGSPSGRSSVRMLVNAEAVELSGISLRRLLFGRGFAVDEVRLTRPHLVRHPGASSPDTGSTGGSGRDSSELHSGGRRVPALPYLEVDEFVLEDGSIDVTAGGEQAEDRLRVDSIRVALSGVVVDSSRSDGWLALDDLELAVANYERISPDSVSVTRVNGLRIAGLDSPLRIDSFTVRPLVDLGGFLRRVEYRKNRLDAALIDISAAGFDYRRLIERRDVSIRSIEVDSLYLHIHLDRRLPADPGGGLPTLPNERMRQLENRVRIDTIRLRRGDLHYAERLPEADSAASLWFREIRGSVRNITNDSSLMSRDTPAILEAQLRFLGEAPSSLTLEMPLLTEEFTARYLGNVSGFRASALNEVTHRLEGILLTGGAADTARFDVRVAQGRATGSVLVLYDSLDVKIVGVGSSTQGLIENLKTLIAEGKLRSSNPPEGRSEPIVGAVRYVYERDDPLFSILWGALRDGLKDALGI